MLIYYALDPHLPPMLIYYAFDPLLPSMLIYCAHLPLFFMREALDVQLLIGILKPPPLRLQLGLLPPALLLGTELLELLRQLRGAHLLIALPGLLHLHTPQAACDLAFRLVAQQLALLLLLRPFLLLQPRIHLILLVLYPLPLRPLLLLKVSFGVF